MDRPEAAANKSISRIQIRVDYPPPPPWLSHEAHET